MENRYLVKARIGKLWTENEASAAVGVVTKTYRRWEAGASIPNMTKLRDLCQAFGENDPEKLGYIVERNRILLKSPEDDFSFIENDLKQPTDDLVQAHEERQESLRRSLKRLSGMVSSEKEASELDKLTVAVMTILGPSLDIAAVGVGMWLCDRVDRIKRISTCERLTIQQYQAFIHAEIESWQRVIDEDYQTTQAYHFTRRTAIETLALFLPSLLTAVQWSSHTDFAAQEFLIQCTRCIMACSYLLNEDGFATVENTLLQYLRQLIKMAKSPSPLQKDAAYLATQACCLMGTIKSHQRQFHEDVGYCKLAVELATVTGNRLLAASAYTKLGTAWFFSDRPEKMLQSYQDAERLIPQVPPFFPPRLQSRIYMGLSNAHACLGHMQDATNYLGMTNAIQLFPSDALFIPVLDYDLSNKISVEGIICRKLGEQEEQKNAPAKAKSWYKRASVALAQILPLDFSERIGIEILNRQSSVAIKLRDKESFMAHQTKAILKAKAIKSDKRINEALVNQEHAKKQWSHEKDVLGLDELFDWDPASHASIPSKFTSIQVLPGYLFPSPRPLYENAWHEGIFFSAWQSFDRAAL